MRALARRRAGRARPRAGRRARQGPAPRARSSSTRRRELLRADRGRLICRTHHGFVCANAGVDASNATAPDAVVLLPADPDASARALRAALRADRRRAGGGDHRLLRARLAHGPVRDRDRLRRARTARRLARAGRQRGPRAHATVIAVADEAAAAADLVRAKDSREPAVRLRGLAAHVGADDGPGARRCCAPPRTTSSPRRGLIPRPRGRLVDAPWMQGAARGEQRRTVAPRHARNDERRSGAGDHAEQGAPRAGGDPAPRGAARRSWGRGISPPSMRRASRGARRSARVPPRPSCRGSPTTRRVPSAARPSRRRAA